MPGPLPDVLPCEERLDSDGHVAASGEPCGEPARVEYLRRPQASGLRAWVAVCDGHAERREQEDLTVRPFTGISRW